MERSESRRAVDAALSVASEAGLDVGQAVVLHNSNKLTLRLLPGDVLARVSPPGDTVARFEVDLAQRLAAVGSPVGALDPRVEPLVHERDGFSVTLWTFYQPGAPIEPAGYADALVRLHAGMRAVDVRTPHFTDRVEEAQRLVADPGRTPELTDADRELLARSLDVLCRAVRASGRPEQLLHGEPHPGNLLSTPAGPRFIDLETCCWGPVEFDLAHAPEEAGLHYPGADQRVLRDCRLLVQAMITTWRWDREDQFPDGRRLAEEWLVPIREWAASA
jgi:hypothetical protein